MYKKLNFGKIIEILPLIDFDFNIVAAELDTMLKSFFYVKENDELQLDSFILNLRTDSELIMSFTENIDMYNCAGTKLILYQDISNTYLIFQSKDFKSVEMFLQL